MEKRAYVFLLYLMLSLRIKSKFGPCSGNDQKCLACDLNLKCLLCIESYIDDKGTCAEISNKIANCLFYERNQTTGVILCKECKYGYQISVNQCIKIQTEFCLNINSEKTEVTQSKTNDIAIVTSKKVVPWKRQSPLDYLSPNPKLKQTTDNSTLTVHINEVCNICSNSILAHLGKCKKTRFCSIENCENCFKTVGKQEKCVQCKTDYALVKLWNEINYCKKMTKLTKNCLYMETKDDLKIEKCVICRINFYNNHNECLRSKAYTITGYPTNEDLAAGEALLRSWTTLTNLFCLTMFVINSFVSDQL